MIEPGFPIDKIHNDDLQRIALERSKDPVSVIIVLDLPEPKVEVGKIERGFKSSSFPRMVIPLSEAEMEEVAKKTSEAKTFLKEILSTEPNFLEMARSFVADVNGDQLRQIASSSLTKSIEPNRVFLK